MTTLSSEGWGSREEETSRQTARRISRFPDLGHSLLVPSQSQPVVARGSHEQGPSPDVSAQKDPKDSLEEVAPGSWVAAVLWSQSRHPGQHQGHLAQPFTCLCPPPPHPFSVCPSVKPGKLPILNWAKMSFKLPFSSHLYLKQPCGGKAFIPP